MFDKYFRYSEMSLATIACNKFRMKVRALETSLKKSNVFTTIILLIQKLNLTIVKKKKKNLMKTR